MNIVSCDNCGVLFDKSKLNFPSNFWDCDEQTGEDFVIKSAGTWSVQYQTYVPYVNCPVCGEKILDEDE